MSPRVGSFNCCLGSLCLKLGRSSGGSAPDLPCSWALQIPLLRGRNVEQGWREGHEGSQGVHCVE